MAGPTSDQLTAAYMTQVAAVRRRVLTFAVTLWGASSSLRDVDVDRLVARIVPVVQGGQLQVAGITNAYVQRLAAVEGVTAATVGVDRADVVTYRGTPPEDVYRRPAVETYSALAAGEAFTVARDKGLKRLQSIVKTDIQQSRNRQARSAYAETGFDFTVRVLSGAENCALCVIASTQRYRRSDLQPIHPGCDCGERGVKGEDTPEQVIDPDLLELTHRQIDAKLGGTDRGARDLSRGKADSKGRPISDFTDLIITREHGELGPTLAWRDEHFTSASDIDALP